MNENRTLVDVLKAHYGATARTAATGTWWSETAAGRSLTGAVRATTAADRRRTPLLESSVLPATTPPSWPSFQPKRWREHRLRQPGGAGGAAAR